MGREIRRVAADWNHPKRGDGRYVPLHQGYRLAADISDWDEGKALWDRGLVKDYSDKGDTKRIPEDSCNSTYEEWDGERPFYGDYMPAWTPEQATHYMMYEDTTEGTPKTPAFATPEEVAQYCVENGVSYFGGETASYETWLYVANGGCGLMAVQPSTGWMGPVHETIGGPR